MARRNNINRTGKEAPTAFPNEFSAMYDAYINNLGSGQDPFEANRREIQAPHQAPWAQALRRDTAMGKAAQQVAGMNFNSPAAAVPQSAITADQLNWLNGNNMPNVMPQNFTSGFGGPPATADPRMAQVTVPDMPVNEAGAQGNRNYMAQLLANEANRATPQAASPTPAKRSLWDRFKNADNPARYVGSANNSDFIRNR